MSRRAPLDGVHQFGLGRSIVSITTTSIGAFVGWSGSQAAPAKP
jgi:hypothetical protein